MDKHIAVLEEIEKECREAARISAKAHMEGTAYDFLNIADRVAAAIAMMRAPVGDVARMDWLEKNVTETLTAKSIHGEYPYPEHKTQYVLPKLIAWMDFCGQITFREAVDAAMQQTTKEGGE